MAELSYLAMMSLDGFMEDADGGFGWAAPSAEVHAFVNDLMRPAGTYLYGRRMYETMTVWETDPSFAATGGAVGDFAGLWQAADKVVYSSTLDAPSTRRTRIERTFNADAVRKLVAASDRDLMIGGPTLAAHAFAAGLIARCHIIIAPVLVGAGKPGLPVDRLTELDLVDHRTFASGAAYLRYQVRHA